jgi:HEAT repeat protein
MYKPIAMLVVVFVLAPARLSYTYPVPPSLPLDKLVQEADVIVKAVIVGSRPLDDEPWFRKCPGFRAYTTELKVISVIKGDVPAGAVVFQHYATAKEEGGNEFMPLHYDLQVGKGYLIFSKKTDRAGVLRQLWEYHRIKEDQGVVRAADAKPVMEKAVGEIIWAELVKLLTSPDTQDILYAIRQLDDMSGGPLRDQLRDFERGRVLAAIAPTLSHRDPKVVEQAVRAIGAASPYLLDGDALFWLAAIGGGYIPGVVKLDTSRKNEGGTTCWKELIRTADRDDLPANMRGLAIRALGRAPRPEVEAAVERWLQDRQPPIRQAAALLLADFPGDRTNTRLKKLAGDESLVVRVGAARAVGFGQIDSLLALLDSLLDDKVETVRYVAALSLLSFPPARSEPFLKKRVDDPDFRSVFVNALAQTNPEPYLDALVDIITRKLEPRQFWGGAGPSGDSWNILFKYVQQQDLSRMGRYLDALESVKFYSSSEPRDLYALYVKSGLTDRARRFREKCKKTISFDMEYYSNAVDRETIDKK